MAVDRSIRKIKWKIGMAYSRSLIPIRSIQEVGNLLQLSKHRITQIEHEAFYKIQLRMKQWTLES